MLTRRKFIERSLQGSSLVAAGSVLPNFIARTAAAAEPGGDNILVVVELGGGNDGLNTVIPYGDDLYYKARPTLGYKKDEVLRIDDHLGFHPSLNALSELYKNDRLAVIQGVGYPNPNRSHFESMDIWQSADPRGKISNGWLARSLGQVRLQPGRIAAFHLGQQQLPLALKGSSVGVPSLNAEKPFGLSLGDTTFEAEPQTLGSAKRARPPRAAEHEKLIRALSEKSAAGEDKSLMQFVQRTSVETYKTVDRLRDILKDELELPEGEYQFDGDRYKYAKSGLAFQLQLVARMIKAGFGTRIFYVAHDGFDTHGDQRSDHQNLLATLSEAVGRFFGQLENTEHDKRVMLMTFSEFGRRVHENGSKGTDHGAASCMFLAGASVKAGVIGEHPSLAADNLASGDLTHSIDFRQVYATLLDKWLGCDSTAVLMDKFKHVPLI
jgi:uncharacterized protein (DUF1501 family)